MMDVIAMLFKISFSLGLFAVIFFIGWGLFFRTCEELGTLLGKTIVFIFRSRK